MSNQSELNTVLGFSKYSLEHDGLGSFISEELLKSNTLLLNPQIKSACDRANIHYQGIRGVEEFSYAEGMIAEAEFFLTEWPHYSFNLQRAKRAWSLTKVNVQVMTDAIPEWVALLNMIDLNSGKTSSDPKLNTLRKAAYQYWWGLIAPPNPDKYLAAGKAVTTPITDETLDTFSGFGRKYSYQYYPTLTQAFLNNRTDLLRVKHLLENKKGKIVDVKSVDESRITYATQCPYQVAVLWDDGTRETLSYLGVRQLDPVLDEPMYCRAQQILSPVNYFGKPPTTSEGEPLNDFVNKLAAVLLISAMEDGFGHTTKTAEQIIRLWTNMASGYIQPAAKSVTYNNMKDMNSAQNRTGWATITGQRLMSEIWGVLMTTGGLENLGAKVAQFLDNEIILPLGTVTDSGLVLCPMCKNCETMNRANFVDFGIYTGDTKDGFSSIAWKTRNHNGEPKFFAVGLVKCANCSELYYRLFHSSIRPFGNQLAIGKLKTGDTPNLYLNMVKDGGTSGKCPIIGYSFRKRFRSGDSGLEGLPILRVFGELEMKVKDTTIKKVRADDIPLEIGTQSRNLKKQRWCSGKTRVAFASTMTSHEYFDENIGKEVEGVWSKGEKDFDGTNYSLRDYQNDTRTNMTRCTWCKQVSEKIGHYISETWQIGRGSFAFYSEIDDTEFLELKSASNNSIFNIPGVDWEGSGGGDIDLGDGYFAAATEHIEFYNIKLLGDDGLVKILKIAPDDLGVKIPAVDESLSMVLKEDENPCPNEDKAFLTPYKAFFKDYLVKEQKHFKQKSRFLITEQLAYSAKLNSGTKKWELKIPPDSYLKDENNGYNSLFNSIGENALEWKDGNRPSKTPDGDVVRFPEPRLGWGTSATIITPFADNRQTKWLKQYHILKRVGTNRSVTVDPESGRTIKTIIPFLYCEECNKSFHGAPAMSQINKEIQEAVGNIPQAAMIWKFPEPVGQEVFKNGWDIDSHNLSLKFYPKKLETTRRDDGGGGYDVKSDWHWTLPLYTENKPFGTWLNTAIVNDSDKVRELGFTKRMMKWITAGQEFPAKDFEGGELNG